MRRVAVLLAAMLGVSGCAGIKYQGTEEKWQQLLRYSATLMNKNPDDETIAAAGKAAHSATSWAMDAKAEEKVDWQGAGWRCPAPCFSQ